MSRFMSWESGQLSRPLQGLMVLSGASGQPITGPFCCPFARKSLCSAPIDWVTILHEKSLPHGEFCPAPGKNSNPLHLSQSLLSVKKTSTMLIIHHKNHYFFKIVGALE